MQPDNEAARAPLGERAPRLPSWFKEESTFKGD